MRAQIGIEVEPFEMLEMTQLADTISKEELDAGIAYVLENWSFEKPCDKSVIENGVRYALAISKNQRTRLGCVDAY